MTASLITALELAAPSDHTALFYHSAEEQAAVTVPYIQVGLERGEQCLYIAHENPPEAVIETMRTGGVNVGAAIDAGALQVISSRDVYLRDGYFNADRMLAFAVSAAEAARAGGYTGVRGTGEMSWALDGASGVEQLMDYESRLNSFVASFPATALCQYDLAAFPTATLFDAVRTHPRVIVHDMLCENDFYTPPGLSKAHDRLVHDNVGRLLETILETQTRTASGFNIATAAELITAYVDGELAEPIAKQVAARLQSDPALAHAVAVELATKRTVAQHATRYHASSTLTERIRAHLFGRRPRE